MRAQESANRKSALACRIESAISVADVGNAEQVLGTSDRAQNAVRCFYRTRQQTIVQKRTGAPVAGQFLVAVTQHLSTESVV